MCYNSLLKGGAIMYSFMNKLFSDKEDGVIFECFGIWHWIYLLFFTAITVFSVYYLKNKDSHTRKKFTNIFINVVFCLYVADFFLMPFALGEIDIDKLPFHSCTAMCVMCFMSNHNGFLSKYRTNFAMLGFLSNMMYIVYPSGVASYETHPFSYRAAQTLLFHGFMVVYGLLVIIFNEEGLNIRKCHRDLVILLSLTCWALIGNGLYSGELGGYSHSFNWFFIRQDPFDLFPSDIAPYITPIVNIIAFFSLEIIIYLCYSYFKEIVDGKKTVAQDAEKKVYI